MKKFDKTTHLDLLFLIFQVVNEIIPRQISKHKL